MGFSVVENQLCTVLWHETPFSANHSFVSAEDFWCGLLGEQDEEQEREKDREEGESSLLIMSDLFHSSA